MSDISAVEKRRFLGSNHFKLIKRISVDLVADPSLTQLNILDQFLDNKILKLSDEDERLENEEIKKEREGENVKNSEHNDKINIDTDEDLEIGNKIINWRESVFQYLIFPVHLIIKDQKMLVEFI